MNRAAEGLTLLYNDKFSEAEFLKVFTETLRTFALSLFNGWMFRDRAAWAAGPLACPC